MKIHIPGIGTQYVDEDPPVPELKIEGGITVEEAIARAQARAGLVPIAQPQTEVLRFTREVGTEAPLIDNSQGVSNPDNVSGQLEHGKVEVPAVPEVSERPALASAPVSEPAKEVDPLEEFGASTPSDDLLK